jgi:hypothetical protein
MDTNTILKAWKQSEDENSIIGVAGQVVVDENLLRKIGGGYMANELSSGYFCTISGECWPGGSCWPF